MYKKPPKIVTFDYSSSGGSNLDEWRPGLQIRIPTNRKRDYSLNKFFSSRTFREGASNSEYYNVKSGPTRIIVDSFNYSLSDDW